jgi:hypothetical protein
VVSERGTGALESIQGTHIYSNLSRIRAKLATKSCPYLLRDWGLARTASKTQAALYDKYDITNNTAAVTFLLDSLAPVLAEIVSEKMEETDSFHVVWLELMNEIQVQTIEHIKAIKKEIKDRRPQQYPGQDLEKLAVHFRSGALELQNARQEHNLTLSMVKSYLAAGGTDNEDYYRYSLRGLKSKLNDELLAIGYMDKTQADAHMVKENLH